LATVPYIVLEGCIIRKNRKFDGKA
jgi:hypothetical protein